MNTTQITVDVTQEDIARGIACKCDNCPVSLAIKRATGRAEVSVFPGTGIWFGYHGIPTPESVANFIIRFDVHEPVAPFSFTLDVPTQLIKQ